jgi:ATP-binding cassette subfamily C protein
MSVLRKIFDLLTKKEKLKLYLLFGVVLITAVLQVVSVFSIMPFLSVAADPSSIHSNKYLEWAYTEFGFSSNRYFLVSLGLGALAALVVSNTLVVLTTWGLYKFVWRRNHTISKRLLESYLDRPYSYFITKNSSELGKNILEEAKEVSSQLIKPILEGAVRCTIAIFIIAFLFVYDPIVSIVVSTVLVSSYFFIYTLVKKRLEERGERKVSSNTERYKLVNEAFKGIKEVKIRGKEKSFTKQFIKPSIEFADNHAMYRVIKKIPRYVLEAVAFGGIILIAIYLVVIKDNLSEVIPVLGLYAFAGYRLMPALQKAFNGIASARFNVAALEAVHEGISDHPLWGEEDNLRDENEERLPLDDKLCLRDVSFSYPDAESLAIENLSLNIPANTVTGFVGKTGSGKTTTVDLILGLLRPQSGSITIDGTQLCEDNLRAWQRNVGYVPQDIYLSDDSVARNIAFGVPPEDIDLQAVKEAARKAHIYQYIENALPNQWRSVVGERGVKLSGGQKQRIGIARALYHDPSVLVLDEATSALDQETESSVMEAIYNLEGNHTMFMIAHRLSTVRRADNIIMLENGKKVGEGGYEELRHQHSKFRSMALS